MEINHKSLAVFLALVLVTASFATLVTGFSDRGDTDILMVSLEGENDVNRIESIGGDVLQEYPDRALVEIPERAEEELRSTGIEIASTLPARTELSVKGHQFDINEGMPEFSDELTIDGYEEGEEGLYLIKMIGPVHSEWRARLESEGIDIINYQPNYAYEVRMTPDRAERVEDLDFVETVEIYQPGFKLAEDIEPGLVSVSLSNGERSIMDVDDEDQLVELANRNDVYYINEYHEPQLLDEQATQTIGGGLLIWDPEDDPDSAYRGHGDYGSLATQLGYDGDGNTIVVADTGLDDGTTDIGHPDFGDRVIGGYDYETESYDEGEWDDGHGHGTHTAGSMAGHTHGGTGETDYEDYYAAEGTAPASELYGVKIFDDGGEWVAGDDYHEIVEIPAQDEDSVYIHSNSWGAETEGEYTESDEDFDRAVRDANRDSAENEPMVITVAAGNAGPGARGGGYNSVGSPGNAKNAIVVGSTGNYPDSDPEAVSGFSSRGWTDDNRVKPDVMAPGEDIYSTEPESGYQDMQGTSMANPAVAGAASSLVDWYESTHGETPEPSMVRALLINTAYDMENTQDDTGENSPYIPNQDEGWGMVNLPNVVHTDVNMMLENEDPLIETGETHEYEIEQDDGAEPLRISLTWTDEAAADGDEWTLENDLNLEVESPSGEIYRGNNLVESWSEPGESTYDTFDTNDDGWDDVNNVENVYLLPEDVEEGAYTVRVIGHDVPSDANNDGDANQDYSIVKWNAVEADTEPGPLAPTDPDPADGATGVATDPELSVYAEHEDGDNMDVSFYDSSGDSLIGEDNNVQSGTRAETEWTGLDEDTVYDWYAVADDGDQTATSSTWSFTTESADPPTITLTRPTGGEVWTAGDNEDITWDSTAGDGTITGVDLDYSLDGGDSWTNIVTGTEDDGEYTWTVPDEETEEAMIQATIHDDNDLSDTDTSGEFTIEGTTPPEITITRPEGGEEWNAGDNEDITWDSTEGDAETTVVDLEYSVDDGETWEVIVEGTEDDGVYTWEVPDESSNEARVRGTVYDENDLSDEDVSAQFSILGTGPEAPENLDVEHHGVGEGGEEYLYPVEEIDIDNLEGEIEYLQHDPESDDAYDNWYESIDMDDTELHVGMDAPAEEADGEQTIGVLLRRTDNSDRTPEVTIELYQDDTLIDTLADELEIEDPVGEVHHFNFDAADLVDSSGEDVTVELSAPRTGGPGGDRNAAEYGAVEWEANTLGEGEGDEDNLVTWDASPDDPDEVNHYNVYSAEEEDGDYEFIGDVEAEGLDEYEYIDSGAGAGDETLWYYEVEAEDEFDQTSERTGPEREPGPLAPTDPQPEDGATGVGPEEVDLSVYVEHSEEEMTDTVTFYDASDDSEIGFDEEIDHGTRTAEVTWDGLEEDQTYDWYAVAEDAGGTVQSETWQFTTGEVDTVELTIEEPEGEGDVYVDGESVEVFPYEEEYVENEEADLLADPAEGWEFSHWTGVPEEQEEDPDILLEMDQDRTVTATFEEVEYTLAIDSTEGGEVVEPGEEEYTYGAGEMVDLEAVADEDYHFVEWTGDVETIEDTTARDTTITMEDDYTITAEFEAVEVDEVEITDPSEDQTITAGETITIEAEAYDGEELITDDRTDFEWESATRGIFNRRRVGDYQVTATYEGETSDPITVTVEPAEADRIEISPEEETIEAGSTLTYTAVAYDEYKNEIGEVSEETTWSIEDGAGGSWAGNEYTSEVAGEYWTVTGDHDGSTDTALLTVEPGAVETVELEPSEDQTITSGEKLEFSAVAYDAHENLIADNVEAFDWQNALRGVFYYETPGEYDVTATYGEVTSEPVTVTVEEEGTEDTSSTEGSSDFEEDFAVIDEMKSISNEKLANTKTLSL